MQELKFTPVGELHPTPMQRQEQYIKRLEQWVAALSLLGIVLLVIICILASGVVTIVWQ